MESTLVIREDVGRHMSELKAWLNETADIKLERMADFFSARLDGYEAHMSMWAEAYRRFADIIPAQAAAVLDLGCGTGLEIDALLSRLPELQVTGIDLSADMLAVLKIKHPEIRTICADYFEQDFGENAYDLVISFESLHHFRPEKKALLYGKIHRALKAGGTFVEADYIACCEEEETLLAGVCAQKRRDEGIPEDVFVHFDTPLTAEHECALISGAGFTSVSPIGCVGGVCFISALKD